MLNRHESLSESPEHANTVGFLMYLEQRDGCFLKIALDARTFDRLQAVLEIGRMPNHISVRVEGLSYGPSMEGRDAVLDVNKQERLRVTEVSFNLPIGAELPTPAVFGQHAALSLTTVDFAAAQLSLRHELQGVRRTLSMVVVLLVIILVVLVLWHALLRY